MPKISIIVPVYKVERYLHRCIDSIIAQSFTDFELILVDDGSPDNCAKICDEYLGKDKRVKVIHKTNGGVSSARNVAINICKGEYISFIDSDDFIDIDMLDAMYHCAVTNSVEIVMTNFFMNDKLINAQIPLNKTILKDDIAIKILPSFSKDNTICIFAFTNKLFSKEVINRGNIRFNESLSYQEDLLFMLSVYANASSMYYIDKAFYHYEVIQGGLYSSYKVNAFHMLLIARKEIYDLIKKYNIVNVDYNNLNIGFLYNITFQIYRTNKHIIEKKQRKILIDTILTNNEVIKCCSDMLSSATSFDRRIASAVVKGNKLYAIWMINFIFSNRKDKIIKLYLKIRGGLK